MMFRLFSIALISLTLVAFGKAWAGELVYFGSSACTYCDMWDEEIGDIYPKTDEAKILPLRRVSVHDDVPEDLVHIRGVLYTPTFVAVEDGKEVGRISGYPGEDIFWEMMAVMMRDVRQYRTSACQVTDQPKPEYC